MVYEIERESEWFEDCRSLREMVLNVDLNLPAAEGALSSSNPEAPSAESSKGLFGSPIDVEAIDDDDEVQLLYSSEAFPQSRRGRRQAIDLEVAVEIPPEQSGVSLEVPAAILLSLSSHGNHASSLTSRTNLHAQLYFDLEEDDDTKGTLNLFHSEPHIVTPPSPPPLQLLPTPKEPTFSCPLCMDPITIPCSTACGHIFCESCIEASLKASVKVKKGKFCPSCRTKLPAKKSYHRVYLPSAE